MNRYCRKQLSDDALLIQLKQSISREQADTALVLADLAEVDARKLYLPAGYSSMHSYCIEVLHLSEHAAFKRIRAARLARRFPSIFPAVADGRLHLSGLVLLTPYLIKAGPATAAELLASATHKSKAQIEELLAERFPGSENLPLVVAMPVPAARAEPRESEVTDQLAPGLVGGAGSADFGSGAYSYEPEALSRPAASSECTPPRSEAVPLAVGRFTLRLSMSQDTHDKLQYAQSLLSHAIWNGDLEQVLGRVLDLAIEQLEKRKFGATTAGRRNVCR